MITRSSDNITWDVENRPVTISQASGNTTFVYDGDGNRVKKTEGGIATLYINKYFEKSGSDNVSNYFLGDKLVAIKEGSTLRYIHQDHLTGTAVASSDNGSLVDSIKYEPYGSTRSGSVPTEKKFTGQRLDGTGLYYYKSPSIGPASINTLLVYSPLTINPLWSGRYYDTTIGRFISPDTIVQDYSNPQMMNRYTYTLNNPLKYTDPDGHWLPLIAAGIGAVASTGIYLWAHRESGATLSGAAGAFVSGAVAGALSVVAFPAFVGMAEAGVLLGITTGGLASVTGYGAGVVTENAVSSLTGTTGQASFTDEGAYANLVGGMVGSAVGQVGTALYVGVESTINGSLNSGLQAFSKSLRSIEANSTESTLVGLGVSSISSAIATSYSQVTATLGQNQIVAWSSARGYYTVDASSVIYDE